MPHRYFTTEISDGTATLRGADAHHLARVDFMLDTVTMEDYALEVNTLPGMTPTSLMPQEAQALGLSFDDLCEWILAVSLKKYK